MSGIDNLRIISQLNTKVRRLGYLVSLAGLLKRGSSGEALVVRELSPKLFVNV